MLPFDSVLRFDCRCPIRDRQRFNVQCSQCQDNRQNTANSSSWVAYHPEHAGAAPARRIPIQGSGKYMRTGSYIPGLYQVYVTSTVKIACISSTWYDSRRRNERIFTIKKRYWYIKRPHISSEFDKFVPYPVLKSF